MGLEGRLSNADVWNYDLFSGAGSGIRFVPTPPTSEFQKSSLSVEYCLAEPFGTFCQIGLASTLLWVVSLCILLKTVLCFVVLTKLGKITSLVTPGDVIESGIGPLIYFVISSYHVTRWLGSFGQDAQNEKVWFRNGFLPTFEQAILIANSPQLFLSFAYLAFNGLFTRLHMAKEWSAMGTRYKALRVTNPKGQQSSTYFLQLPYRYSVPLLTISISLHWILSGCIYILLMQGDYFGSSGSDGPFGSSMALGFSTKSLFTMLTLSVFMAFMPLLFGLIPLPPKAFVVGSNSHAIAAACQVSLLIGQNQPQAGESYHKSTAEPQNDEFELRHLIAPSYSLLPLDDQASNSRNDEEVWKDTLLRVSRSKIKWGVVKMPSSWEEQFNRRDIAVEHISFGLPEDDVQQPIVGHWYA
ncbi:hypothetical protein FJTKL_09335 [Diaporthe vaccinii]|uniref:Uncharacterized protein n=1 Tax=Diaporthe vaccinii TaxID=105482 RepID=A0ABR4FCE4_9PEZI